MKDRLLIIGASGHGKVVADIALKMKKWQTIAFLDDNEDLKESMGLQVIGKSGDASSYVEDSDVFVAIGNNATREKIITQLESVGAELPLLIHPHAVIGEQVELSAGTVVMAGVVINSSTRIGKGCIINTGSTIDHDNLIEDYVHISPGVNTAGTVTVGCGTWLGIGSKVSNNVNINSCYIVGAGAVVVKDITGSGTYVGVTARRL